MLRAGTGLFQANASKKTSVRMKQRRLLIVGAALVMAGAAIGAPTPPRRPPEFNRPKVDCAFVFKSIGRKAFVYLIYCVPDLCDSLS